MSKPKPKISARKPPAVDVAAFVQGRPAAPTAPASGEPATSGLPVRKQGWLAGQAARRTTIIFPADTFDALERRCFEQRTEISAYVTEAVRAALAAPPPGEKPHKGGGKAR